MNEEQANLLIHAVRGHGDQLGDDAALFGRFLQRLQTEQQEFLAEQRAASDAAQRKANWTAVWSAIAAGASAFAGIAQAFAAFMR